MHLKDPNLHQKLQEMCDCYMDTDYAGQMAAMSGAQSADQQEDAVKYLALALMNGITEKARKLSIKRKNGEIRTILKTADAKIELPPPSERQFTSIIDLMRAILHLENEGGKSPLTLGLRNSQLDLQVKLKEKENKMSLKVTFPELGE